MSALILYRTDDGQAEINLRIAYSLKEGELAADSVVKESLTTAADGKTYRTKLFSLPLILAVGYCLRSPRGTRSRQWARRCVTGACPHTRIVCSLRANTTRLCCARRPVLKPTGYFFVPSHLEAQS